MNRYFLVLLFISISIPSFARKPAVDPVRGISIEEYQKANPGKTKGFNFEKKQESRTPAMKSKNLSAGDEKEISITMLFFVLLSLHIGAWFFISKKVKKDYQSHSEAEAQHSSDDHDDFDQMNFPKAS